MLFSASSSKGGRPIVRKPYYTTERINDHLTAIWSGCGEVLYFVTGQDRGLLMDTNLGVGHLKALVDSLTDKPYEVVITHGHIDHALGAPEYEKVYMNHSDIPIYQAMCPMEERIGYLQANLGPAFEDYGFEENDFVQPEPNKYFEDLEDEMIFDLGGIHVQIISFPGHTPGSMALLIQEDRILITGDACNDSTFLFDEYTSTVEDYRAQVLRVKNRLDGQFDRVFICHHAIETGADLLDNMIRVCDDVMEGRSDDLPFHFRGIQACIAKKCSPRFVREDGKSGNLIYVREKVFSGREGDSRGD